MLLSSVQALDSFLNRLLNEAPDLIETYINNQSISFVKLNEDEIYDEESFLEYSFKLNNKDHVFQIQFWENNDASPYRLEIRTPDNKSYQITCLHLKKIGFATDETTIEFKQIVKVSGQDGDNQRIKGNMCDLLEEEGLLRKEPKRAEYWHIGTYDTNREQWSKEYTTEGFIRDFFKVALILAHCRGNRGIDLGEVPEQVLDSHTNQMIEEVEYDFTGNQISADEYKELREQWEEIGIRGEMFALAYEREWLLKNNRRDLIQKTSHVSQYNSGAGYDILSYELDGRPKYIEVKTSKGKSNSFEISSNEWKRAKQYGEKYFIYRVTDVFNDPKIEVLKSPYRLFENEKVSLEPTSYKLKYKNESACLPCGSPLKLSKR